MRIRAPLTIAIAALLTLALGTAVLAATMQVTISDFQFTPSTMTVNVGDTVRWTNQGPSMHTTTSDTGLWDSGALGVGQSFAHTFTVPGTFVYHCSIHPQMHGTIAVAAAQTAQPAAPAAVRSPQQLPSTSTDQGGFSATAAEVGAAILAFAGLGALALMRRARVR